MATLIQLTTEDLAGQHTVYVNPDQIVYVRNPGGGDLTRVVLRDDKSLNVLESEEVIANMIRQETN